MQSVKTKKGLAALWLLCLILVLAACSGGKGGDRSGAPAGGESGGSASPAAGKVTLTFWNGFTGPDRPAYEELVKKFNAEHPKIEVVMDITPWDSLLAKLPTSFVSGQGPDIAGFDSALIPKYAKANLILPLDELYGADGIDPGVLPEGLLKAMKYGNHYYGAPANFATLMMYYNKDLFKEAGLDPNKPPATWDEWKVAIEKTTKTNGSDKQYGFVLGDHSTIPVWPILMWGGGADFVSEDGTKATLDTPEFKSALEFWTDLIANKGASPTNLTGAESDKLFSTGKAAMTITGPWMTSGFTEAGLNYDVAPVPAGPKGSFTLANSVALVAGKDTKHKAEVLEFMKFWNSKASQEYLSVRSGFPPSRLDLEGSEKLKENPFVPKFASVAKSGKFYLQGVEDYTKVDTDIVTPLIQAVTNKQMTVEEAIKTYQPMLQNALDGRK